MMNQLDHLKRLSLLLAAPAVIFLASCATPTGPVAHRHGDLVHKHVLTPADGNDHQHGSVSKKTKKAATAAKRGTVKITPAKPSEIKPFGLGHKHHSHVDPKSGETTAPC